MVRSRVFVLGLDGVPYTLLQRFTAEGVTPNMAALLRQGQAVQTDSVYPTVSNVAWACFQTGKNPGKFDIFGFAEVDSRMQLRLPNGAHLRSDTVEEIASRAGRKVVSLGIPTGYPPRPVNGLMVGGFLAPALDKAVYPANMLGELKSWGYKLDIDPVRARTDLDYFRRELLEVFDARRRTAEALLGDGCRGRGAGGHVDWDLFILHVMETDRINHFLWGQWESGEPAAAKFFEDFYRRVDDFIGWLAGKLGDDDVLLIMSDHGFCKITAEVELNRLLMREGHLKLAGDPIKLMFGAVAPDSAAFALVPGRVHILQCRDGRPAAVHPGQYEGVRAELIGKLQNLGDPAAGRKVCKSVFTREQVFSGPYVEHAPDIIIDPADGYDFKAALSPGEVFSRSPLTGMHTYWDAFFYARGRKVVSDRRCVTDVTASLLQVLDVPAPADLDSRGIFAP